MLCVSFRSKKLSKKFHSRCYISLVTDGFRRLNLGFENRVAPIRMQALDQSECRPGKVQGHSFLILVFFRMAFGAGGLNYILYIDWPILIQLEGVLSTPSNCI